MPAIFHFIREFHDRASVSEQMENRGARASSPLERILPLLFAGAPWKNQTLIEKACAGITPRGCRQGTGWKPALRLAHTAPETSRDAVKTYYSAEDDEF